MSRNIIINPNRGTTGSTEQPYITFSGLTSGSINLVVEDDGSLTFDGETGSLFGISDNKDGLLHSVNDVSGLPILSVYDDDRVVMGKWDEPTLTVSGQTWNVNIGRRNVLSGVDSNILGGSGNTINASVKSVIVGGRDNIINGGEENFIGGGQIQTMSGSRNFIGGGGAHVVTNFVNTIGGGYANSATTSNYITIGGGYGHSSSGEYSTIAGGSQNVVTGVQSTIGGGRENKIYNSWSFIGGGEENKIYDGNNTTIGGGFGNVVSGGTDNTLVGGGGNKITSSHRSFLGGGGHENTVSSQNNILSSDAATLVGGQGNKITSSNLSFIGGGKTNIITSSNYSLIDGGQNNTVSGGTHSSIVGGLNNVLSGVSRSVILGGQNITGTTSDTVYVPNLNIGTLGGGTSINNLGIDVNGNIVTGTTTGGEGYWSAGTGTNSVVLQNTTGVPGPTQSTSTGQWGFVAGWSSTNSGDYSSIVGGLGHEVTFGSDVNGIFAGQFNKIINGADNSVVAGGAFNNLGGSLSGIFAGGYNQIIGSSNYSSIIGGSDNALSGTNRSVILGGQNITGTTNNTVFTPNLMVTGDEVIQTNLSSYPIGTITAANSKGSIVVFDHNGPVGVGAYNLNQSGTTAFQFGDLSAYPSESRLGQLTYISTGYTRTGSPTTGEYSWGGKVVLRGLDDTNGMVYNLGGSNGQRAFSWETTGESLMVLHANDGAPRLCIDCDPTDLEYKGDATVQIGSTGNTASFKYVDGNQQNGYVLTSDSNGNATWQASTGGGIPEATTATTTTINFSGQTIYYNASSPGTGNITGNLTGAKLGLIQKIYHNDTVEPTYPAGWVLMGDAIYFTSTLNIIYAEWATGTRVEYWYVQEQ